MSSQDVVASGREVVEVSIKGSEMVIAPSAAEVFGGENCSVETFKIQAKRKIKLGDGWFLQCTVNYVGCPSVDWDSFIDFDD